MSRARQLWDYLRLGIPVQPAECLLVFGGHDLAVAERAAELYLDGVAPLVIVSGGSRAVPDGSEFVTEADAIADVLLRCEVPENVLVLERLAANTSEKLLAVSRRTMSRSRVGAASPATGLALLSALLLAHDRDLRRSGGGAVDGTDTFGGIAAVFEALRGHRHLLGRLEVGQRPSAIP